MDEREYVKEVLCERVSVPDMLHRDPSVRGGSKAPIPHWTWEVRSKIPPTEWERKKSSDMMGRGQWAVKISFFPWNWLWLARKVEVWLVSCAKSASACKYSCKQQVKSNGIVKALFCYLPEEHVGYVSHFRDFVDGEERAKSPTHRKRYREKGMFTAWVGENGKDEIAHMRCMCE